MLHYKTIVSFCQCLAAVRLLLNDPDGSVRMLDDFLKGKVPWRKMNLSSAAGKVI